MFIARCWNCYSRVPVAICREQCKKEAFILLEKIENPDKFNIESMQGK